MSEDKPDLAEVAEAFGGAGTAVETPKETAGEKKLREDRELFDKIRVKYSADQKGETPKPRSKKEINKDLKVEEKEEEIYAKEHAKRTLEGEEKAKAAREEEAKKATEHPEESDESRKARAFLRLKQAAPTGVIESLSPSEAVEWHSNVARREAEIDRTYRELSELRKQSEEPEASKEAERESATPAVEFDVEPLKARFAAALGEEESEGIAAELQTAFTRGVEPYQQLLSKTENRLQALEQTLDDARRRNTDAISASNRARLTETLSVLGSSDVAWQAVERQVIEMAKSNPAQFSGPEAYFDEAVKLIYGSDAFDRAAEKPTSEEEQAAVEEEKAQVSASTPTIQTKKASPKPLTGTAADRRIFDHLDKHPGDIRGAQRAARVG